MTYLNKYCASLNFRQKNPTWECGKTKKLQLCFVHLFYRHLTDKQWHKITFLSLFFTFNISHWIRIEVYDLHLDYYFRSNSTRPCLASVMIS